jgi:hypothetical protein
MQQLADLLTETGITVRPKWISDLRSEAAMQYEKTDKVFRATNNLLKKFEFDMMPENALVMIQKKAA